MQWNCLTIAAVSILLDMFGFRSGISCAHKRAAAIIGTLIVEKVGGVWCHFLSFHSLDVDAASRTWWIDYSW
jgi:hypothetical protein